MDNERPPDRKVTIIGAGLVGCLWAILLRQKNFEVKIFEKRADLRLVTEDSGRSINLVITSRGLHALELAGLSEKALAISVPVYGRMIHSKTGDQVYQAYGQEGERNLSISRGGLNRFLLEQAEAAGAQIHFEHAIETIDFENQTVLFGNGLKHHYELLFAADGAGSVVRKTLARQFPNESQEKTEWITADYKELFLPAPNSLDKKSLHIWPRGSHMMMALANLDGSFTVTAYLPKKGAVSFENLKSSKDIEQLFLDEFADAIPLMPEYLKDFESNPQGGLGTVHCSHWIHRDSVALMGDAAHAIVPFFGQGMNSGFEDCTCLLGLLNKGSGSWSAILAEYDRTQRPNANAIAEMALENWREMSEKVGDPNFLRRKKLESTLEKNFPYFKSRYGMVTYTLIPYHVVQKAGVLQDQILATLMSGGYGSESDALRAAGPLLQNLYQPFLKRHGLL